MSRLKAWFVTIAGMVVMGMLVHAVLGLLGGEARLAWIGAIVVNAAFLAQMTLIMLRVHARTSSSLPLLITTSFFDAALAAAGIEGVDYVVLMPNAKGFDRFEECQKEGYGADTIILMISSSTAHNEVNFRMDHAKAMKVHAGIIERAHKLGVQVIGCAGTVYGCPITGDVPLEKVVDVTRFYVEAGVHSLMLGDTTGAANPNIVRQRIGHLLELFPKTDFIAHFHETRGTGIVNSVAALELGLKYVDCSLGAIGGQPATGANKYQFGFTGNTCSEDLICLLEEMGYDTGIDLPAMLANGKRAEEVIGIPLRANILRSGLVNHEPKTYAPKSEATEATSPSV